MREDDLVRLRVAFEAGDEPARIALGDLYEARGDVLGAETVRAGFLPLDRAAAAASLVTLVDLLEARLRTEPTLGAVDALEVLGYLDSNYEDLDANDLVTMILRTPPGETLRLAVRRMLRQRDLNASVLKGSEEQRLRARLEAFILPT